MLSLNNNIRLYFFFSDADKSVPNIIPLFITIDPIRDSVDAVAKYVKGKFLEDEIALIQNNLCIPVMNGPAVGWFISALY